MEEEGILPEWNGHLPRILWKPAFYSSLAIYLVVLLFTVFSSKWAVLSMFVLLGMWSRIPCLASPFLKDVEIVDILTVVVGLNYGGVIGGVFGGGIILFTKLFGPREYPGYTMKEAVDIFAAGLVAPFFFHIFNGDMFATLNAFTVVRFSGYILLAVLFEPDGLFIDLFYTFCNIFTSVVVNKITSYFLGDILADLLNQSQVTWTLFAITSFIMVGFYLVMRFTVFKSAKKLKIEAEKAQELVKKPQISQKIQQMFVIP